MSDHQPTPPPVTGPIDRPLSEPVDHRAGDATSGATALELSAPGVGSLGSPPVPAAVPWSPSNAPVPEPSGFSYTPPAPDVRAPDVPANDATAYAAPPLPVPYESRAPERYALPPKETGLAYVFLLLFGGLGVHQFYLGKVGRGLLYIFTVGGFLGILPLIDLFTLPSQVRRVNTERAILGRDPRALSSGADR